MSVDQFRVGLGNPIVNSRYSPAALTRADLLTATDSGVDSFWVGDHLNSLFPRSIATPPLPRRGQTRPEDRRPP